ncbi:hypothetical protein OIO90_000114 [Microbotryomycetes sp. JL221]|nr:hypothetical protein OIO90_000114 [Microbotryomycetes sp. JL221]
MSLVIVPVQAGRRPRPFIARRRNPTYAELSQESFFELANATDMNPILDFNDPDSILNQLLVPRAVGSTNLTRVQRLVERHFTKLGWHVERDEFEQDTPVGPRSFVNLIFTHDPDAARRLVLSAHLDSKYFATHPEDQFVGATDSAAPCAMMMETATALTPWLNQRRDRIATQGGEEGRPGQGETLQIVFFDGEEAFHDWTATDSIYGARHLATKWEQPTETPSPSKPVPPTPLQRISHLVLLDLLGAPQPRISSFFSNTEWFFNEFVSAEERLGRMGFLWPDLQGEDYFDESHKMSSKHRSFFSTEGGGFFGAVGDDHEPFLHRGVPVVHMIPLPFPRVWHTIKDDASALDLNTIKAWTLIIRITIAEYLGLDPSVGPEIAIGDRIRSTVDPASNDNRLQQRQHAEL